MLPEQSLLPKVREKDVHISRDRVLGDAEVVTDLRYERWDTLLVFQELNDSHGYGIQTEDRTALDIQKNSTVLGFGEPNRFGN